MSRQSKIEEQTEALLTPIAEKNGCRVYDVEYGKEGPDWYLNCYIDKDGGVTINDCEAVSRELNDTIDAGEDYIKDPYTLVVSSPGLGRSLTRDRHFAQSIGMEVEGTTFKPFDESKSKAFLGILKSFDQTTVTVEVTAGTKKEPVTQELVLDRKNIAKIRLTVDF